MKRPPQVYQRVELERLIERCGTDWTGLRNRALLVCFYRAGLRAQEACSATLDDLRRQPGGIVLKVSMPKNLAHGAAQRELGLDAKATAAMEAWLEVRGNAPGALFCTGSGRHVLTSYVRALLPRLARQAGISRRVHAHGMRHTFARELHDEGVVLKHISLALGHQNVATTDTYLRSIGATEVIATTQRRTW